MCDGTSSISSSYSSGSAFLSFSACCSIRIPAAILNESDGFDAIVVGVRESRRCPLLVFVFRYLYTCVSLVYVNLPSINQFNPFQSKVSNLRQDRMYHLISTLLYVVCHYSLVPPIILIFGGVCICHFHQSVQTPPNSASGQPPLVFLLPRP